MMRVVSTGSVWLLLTIIPQNVIVNAWTWTQQINKAATPRVSGHSVASTSDENKKTTFLFGGLTGNAGSPCTNDLWVHEKDQGWKRIDTNSNDGPGPRMYSATAILNNNLYLMGGWDPGEPKSGGTFLDDVWKLDLATKEWTLLDDKLPCGPVSRHAACTVGCGENSKIVLHTFRGICCFDGTTWQQPTTNGQHQSPEALSMCAMTPLSESTVLVFGGSTKTQQLSSDAYVLDTNKWEWIQLDTDDDNEKGKQQRPSPRASPCAAQWDDHQAIIFGGASLKSSGYEGGGGLQAQDDTWLLTVGDNHEACWDKIDFATAATTSPSPRLAASLSPTNDGGLLLQGGWDPKGETFDDTWILTK